MNRVQLMAMIQMMSTDELARIVQSTGQQLPLDSGPVEDTRPTTWKDMKVKVKADKRPPLYDMPEGYKPPAPTLKRPAYLDVEDEADKGPDVGDF